MTETNSQSESDSASESDKTATELHERAARLRENVRDLSKTFERIEQNLAEAADERGDSSA